MYFIGVDIGGMSVKVGLIREGGEIVLRDSVPTEAGSLNQEEIILRTASLIKDVAARAGVELQEIRAVGVGSPGTPDNRRGMVIFAGNLGFRCCPVREILSRELGLPVYLGNDANVAALAESRIGVGRGSHSSITITIGTGIGGGVILNDRVYAGFNGAGCELGHMVIHTGGVPCSCGRNGCLEAYAAAPALMRRTEEAAKVHPDSILARCIEKEGGISGKTIFDARLEGCPLAVETLQAYMDDLAEGLANYINCYFPERIILGGGVSKQGEWFRKELEEMTRRKCFEMGDLPQTEICLAQLGNEAGIVGAAFFAEDCLADGLCGLPE